MPFSFEELDRFKEEILSEFAGAAGRIQPDSFRDMKHKGIQHLQNYLFDFSADENEIRLLKQAVGIGSTAKESHTTLTDAVSLGLREDIAGALQDGRKPIQLTPELFFVLMDASHRDGIFQSESGTGRFVQHLFDHFDFDNLLQFQQAGGFAGRSREDASLNTKILLADALVNLQDMQRRIVDKYSTQSGDKIAKIKNSELNDAAIKCFNQFISESDPLCMDLSKKPVATVGKMQRKVSSFLLKGLHFSRSKDERKDAEVVTADLATKYDLNPVLDKFKLAFIEYATKYPQDTYNLTTLGLGTGSIALEVMRIEKIVDELVDRAVTGHLSEEQQAILDLKLRQLDDLRAVFDKRNALEDAILALPDDEKDKGIESLKDLVGFDRSEDVVAELPGVPAGENNGAAAIRRLTEFRERQLQRAGGEDEREAVWNNYQYEAGLRLISERWNAAGFPGEIDERIKTVYRENFTGNMTASRFDRLRNALDDMDMPVGTSKTDLIAAVSSCIERARHPTPPQAAPAAPAPR